MNGMKILIILSHFLFYIVGSTNVWIFARYGVYYQQRVRSLPLIYLGFMSLMVSTSYEITEHIGDNWDYASHTSDINMLFTTFLNLGMVLLALGFVRAYYTDILLVVSIVAAPLLYMLVSKQSIWSVLAGVSVLFTVRLYKVFRDWRVVLFPLFSSGLNVFFAIRLLHTHQQLYHALVALTSLCGPMILAYLAWVHIPRRENGKPYIVP